MRIKRFSKIGRFGAGLKGAAKTGIKGALYGGIAAPVLTLGFGWKKTAPVGAIIGAGIGSKLGWEEGVSSYDYDNDPEYRKNRDKEERELTIKKIKESEEELALFSEIQREYSFKFNIRKLGRNLRVAQEDWISSTKSAIGMDLNPTDVKSMARQMTMRERRKRALNPSVNTSQVKKSYEPYSIDNRNRKLLREKAARGEGAENIGSIFYA